MRGVIGERSRRAAREKIRFDSDGDGDGDGEDDGNESDG